MREILFRGKRIDDGEWAYGYLYITHSGEYEIGSYDKKLDIERFTSVVVPESVGQYTGLKDKNGKKIFEGDILKGIEIWLEKYKNGIVVFRNGSFCVLWQRGEVETFNAFPSMFNIEYEIIGNIYDNPELIRSDAE